MEVESENPRRKATNPVVDFCSQIGAYILYDARQVVYVGRADDIGQRLLARTKDAGKQWDRFSWFGFRSAKRGKLGNLPKTYSSSSLIPFLKAVLIEVLEFWEKSPARRRRLAVGFLNLAGCGCKATR